MRILLDCWMFQGKRKDTYEKNCNFGFEPSLIDAVILSHAHIDHCGLLPKLVKDWFKWPIYCTEATKDLLEIMLFDSAHIQEADYDFFIKHPELEFLDGVLPLYWTSDVQPVLNAIKVHSMHEDFYIGGVLVEIYWAAHILWAGMIKLTYKDESLLFSGDLWRKNTPMLINPEKPSADIIIMETTYWWRKHDPVSLNLQSIVEVINRTAQRWGKVIIPSFAVERTQELLYYIEEAFRLNLLRPVQIYVDSPMATKVTDLFKKHTQCYNQEMQERYQNSLPFQDKHITYTQSADESKELNSINFPCVIISASWMVEAGRIRHHVKNNIENHKNTIMIVGYMAENTLWRKLIEWAKAVKILWKTYQVNAEIVKLNSFSGHADEDELMHWIGKISMLKLKPKKIILVHWETEALNTMKEKVSNLGLDVEIAVRGKTITI